jgi:hypothetical protein
MSHGFRKISSASATRLSKGFAGKSTQEAFGYQLLAKSKNPFWVLPGPVVFRPTITRGLAFSTLWNDGYFLTMN